jgi:hypothetical protein
MKQIGSRSTFAAVAAVAASAALVAGCGSSNSHANSASTGGHISNATFAQAADVSASASGEKVQFSMAATGSSADAFSFSGTGAFNRSPTTGEMSMNIKADGQDINGVSFLINHGTMYLKFPSSLSGELSSLTGGKPWLSINLSELGSVENVPGLSSLLNGNAVNPTQELKVLADSTTNGLKKVGTANVNGVSTTEYSASLDLSKEASAVPASEQAAIKQVLANAQKQLGSTTIPVHVWIDSSNMVRQLEMDISIKAAGQTLPITFKMDVLSYGKQSVPAAPAASQTFDLTNLLKQEAQSGALGSLGNG